MSKTDNLTDFLTDVADAIREKKGTTDLINPQDFSEEIRGIESGGGIVPCEFKDVNFYDYEGTILYSYTWDEFVAKNEMPPLPTHHEGLTCQEWNYTLEEVLEQGGRCDVGAIYDTIDGHTRISIDASKSKDVEVQVKAYSGEVTIEWGDGAIEQLPESQSYVSKKHIYKEGEYTMRIYSAGLFEIRIDFGSNLSYIYGGNKLKLISLSASLVKNITIPNGCHYNGGLYNFTLRHINIPRTQTTVIANSFNSSYSLTSISIPNTCTNMNVFFENAYIENLHIPTNVSNISFSSVRTVQSIRNISVSKKSPIRCEGNCLIFNGKVISAFNGYYIPNGVIQIDNYACTSSIPSNIDLPQSVTQIGTNSFYYIVYPYGVNMGESVTSIGNSAYGYVRNVKYFDFRAYNHIPSISNANAFAGMPTGCVIVVPDNLYDQWIAATNWSSLASRIVKASEFVEPTTE